MGAFRPILAASGLLAASGFDGGKPIDGGVPLIFDDKPEMERRLASGTCRRKERMARGGTDRSIGHCRPMSPARRTRRVWLTAFEQWPFLDGRIRMPRADNPERFETLLELDEAEANRLAGRPAFEWGEQACLITFVGWRTRDPLFVDCFGYAEHAFVLDRLLSPVHLGAARQLHHEGVSVDAALRHC